MPERLAMNTDGRHRILQHLTAGFATFAAPARHRSRAVPTPATLAMNRRLAPRSLLAVTFAITLVVTAAGCGGGAGEMPLEPTPPAAVPTPPPAVPAAPPPPATSDPAVPAPSTPSTPTAPTEPAPPTTPAAPTTGVGSPSAAPSNVQGTAGDGQREYAGSPLAQPLVVTVSDAQGRRMAGVSVAWTVGQGGGGLSAAAATTDTLGQSRSSWTLGATAGVQTVTARVAGLAPVTFTATAEADTVAPRLVGYTMSRREVTVDTAAATITMLLSVVDSGSGTVLASATFNSPRNSQHATCHSSGTFRLESGTRRQGVWRCELTIPRQAEAGIWRISQVSVRDMAGNDRYHNMWQLESAGLPTTLTVASAAADTVAPTLAGLSFTPAAVDVAADSQRVRFSFHVTDAGTGVRSASVTVVSASGGQYRQCFDAALAAGTRADGTWSCSLVIPRAAEAGPWTLAHVWVHDANNYKDYKPAELRAAGFPTEIAVTSATPDTVPPRLVAFSVTPDSVNLNVAAQRVEFTMTVEDAGSGVTSVSASLRPPGASAYNGCVAKTPAAGTPNAGTFRCSLAVSAHGAAGEWEISVDLRDGVGHLRRYTAERLKAAGFRGTLTVTR